MPFSLEDQLKLLNPRLFEELCAQLVKQDFPEAWHVEGAGGDEGIDVFAGEIDKAARMQRGSAFRVWQVKFFRDGVKHKQREKAERSLKRVVQMHQPQFWTLCVPVNLDEKGHEWFQSLRTQYPDITLDYWQADEVVRRVRQDESLIGSYFLRPQPTISKDALKPILGRLDDFESVLDLLDRARLFTKDATDFYNGTIPDWSDIVHNFDAPREQFGKLWQFVAEHAKHPGGRVAFTLITGRSGDGKSTVLMRLGAELVEQGCGLVFYCKDEAQSLHAEQLRRELPNDAVSFVLIDKITRFNVDTLQGFFERLHRESIPVVVIGAAVHSLWEGLNPSLENVADVCEVGLQEMTDNDIEALLDKLSADPARADEYLGALADLTREQQVARFRQKAKRQLLVALLEMKHNRAFKAYVHGELGALENRFGSEVRRACIYVSALHRLDLPMPRNLLQQLLPSTHLDDDVLRRTHGLLAELLPKRIGIVTRHALIAEVIFGAEPYAQRRYYEEIISATGIEHERLIGRTLHALTLRGENALADSLFKIASLQFPDNVVLLQMHAMLARHQGEIKRARELFQKAVEADPKHAPTWQAWAVMEEKQGDIKRARELFQKGAEADPESAPTWQAWAMMEEKQGDIKRARELFQKGVEAGPKHVYVWQAWAMMEEKQGDIKRARELFQKGAEADPKSAPTWQAWAGLEAECGNIGDLDKEFTARWLFKKATEANPNDPLCWTQWAGLEKKQRSWAQAEGLYLCAAEAEQNRKSRARIYFDLATMFANIDERGREKKYLLLAIESNPDDSIAHARLGRTYGFQGEWEKAEQHFKRSLELKPDDRRTQEWYAKMQQARERRRSYTGQ